MDADKQKYFINMNKSDVEKHNSIALSWRTTKEGKNSGKNAWKAVKAIQKASSRSGIIKMTIDEIDSEIALARKEREERVRNNAIQENKSEAMAL